MEVRRIVFYRDLFNEYEKITFFSEELFIMEYTLGRFSELIPPALLEKSQGNLVESPFFNQSNLLNIAENVSKNGLLLIEVRAKHRLDSIIYEPETLNCDIYFGKKDTLIYSFYNNSDINSINIKARLVKDDKDIYRKIKADPEDIELRNYFLKNSIAKIKPFEEKIAVFPDIMTSEQAAKYLNIAEGTIRNLTSQGKIPSEKIGGSRRFRKTDLDQVGQIKKKK